MPQYTVEQLEAEGYEGVDVSIEESLFVYGMVWKLIDPMSMNYEFIYGVEIDETKRGKYLGVWNKFAKATMTAQEFKEKLEAFGEEKFRDYAGGSEILFPNDVYGAVQYFGHLNFISSDPKADITITEE